MSNLARNNIKLAQSLAKEKVTSLLSINGYLLVREESDERQGLLLQWSNTEVNHSFQLIWDTREHWFALGDFNRTIKLNHIEAHDILILPFNVIKLFFRKRYANKITDKIIIAINLENQTESKG